MPHALLRIALVAAATLFALAPVFAGAASPGPSATPPPTADGGDCEAKDDLAGKEACHAALSRALIDACESMRLHRCAPYRDMHVAARAHTQAVEDLITSSTRAYGDYAAGDAAYLDDLAASIREADRTWQAWRDAQCQAEPLLDGMARPEWSDLAEACRADMTRARTLQISARIQQIEVAGE